MWLGYLVYSLSNRAMKLCIETGIKALTSRIRANQTFLTLTDFIEKSINIYDIKWIFYKNIFYNKSNGINLILSYKIGQNFKSLT